MLTKLDYRLVSIPPTASLNEAEIILRKALIPTQRHLAVFRTKNVQTVLELDLESAYTSTTQIQLSLNKRPKSQTHVLKEHSALSLLLKQVTDQESTNKDIILFSHPDAQTVNQAFTQITNFSEYLPATTKEAGLISEIYLNYQQHQQWKQPQPYDAFEL